jgi:amino acid adenylation domain-containing protein
MDFLLQLEQSLVKNAEINAFCIQGKYYSYAAFALRVAAIQLYMEKECPEVCRVGLTIADHIDTYATIVALLLSGRTYIPINAHHPADRTMRIIEQAGISMVFSQQSDSVWSGVVMVDTTAIKDGNAPFQRFTGELSTAYAYILFTSGSTGMPKGTPITYFNLNSFVSAFNALGYELNKHDRVLQMFDLTFDLSVMSYLMPLLVGACVYTVPDKGMKFTNVYALLEEYKLTFALMVPSVLSFLRPYFEEIHLPEMRYSLFCGEALHADVSREWMKCVPNAVVDNVYGPTEATIFCLTYRLPATDDIVESNGIVCIGTPMQGMGCMVVNDNNQPVAEGEKGELCLFGHQVTPGYLDDEKNKVAFFEFNNVRYYRTGDIAQTLPDGNYIYCGRADHQVKIQGFRVELGEIEHHVREECGCNAVAIVITTTQNTSQIEVVLNKESVEEQAVIAALRNRLPSYMIPARVHAVTPFPLNVNGKTDRKELTKIIAEI